jgi:DnaJ-class molecular chaperone
MSMNHACQDDHMDTNDVKVLVQVPCPRCEGTGRLPWDTPGPGGFARDQTKPCPECSERGHVEAPVALPEFKRLLGLS